MAAAKKSSTEVLDGRTCRPWEYLRWEKDLVSAFKAKNLHKFLTGAKPSVLFEDEPEFQFELEEKVVRDKIMDSDRFVSSLSATPARSPQDDNEADSDKETEEVWVKHSPGTTGIRLSRLRSTITNPEFYYRQLAEHKRDLRRLHDQEKVKITGLSKFVGMQVHRDMKKRLVYVHTADYDAQVVEKYSVDAGNAPHNADTPLVNSLEYRGVEGTEKPIRGVVGSVNYSAGISWPELRVPISLLASAGDKPHPNHTNGAKRVLRYMRNHTGGRALILGGDEPVCLVAYSDASYTPEGDSLYQYGYALVLSGKAGAFEVVSKRSKTVSHSSLQSEIKAINEVCKEVESMRRVLDELGCPQDKPTVVYTDSQSAIDLIANYFGYHPKCRHFNRDINYVRQCVDTGLVELQKIPTDQNPSDLLTKLLPADKTRVFTEALLRGMEYMKAVEDKGDIQGGGEGWK